MGKFLLTCSIVIIFILLQTQETSMVKIGRIRTRGRSSRQQSRSTIYSPSKSSHHRKQSSPQVFKPAERSRAPSLSEYLNPLPKKPGNLHWDKPNNRNQPSRRNFKPEEKSRAPSLSEYWSEFLNRNGNFPWDMPTFRPNKPSESSHHPFKPAERPRPPSTPENWSALPNRPGYPLLYELAHRPNNLGNLSLYSPAYPYPVTPPNQTHPPPYPVTPQNPAHPPPYPVTPQIPGYSPHQPYNPQNPHWGHDNPKPWKPKPPKTKLKHVAGAAIAGGVAGAVGGYFLGRVMSNLHFQFNNPNEERWWYENRHRYSDHVYYPQYIQPVPQDIFVRDCVNITVKEYIEPTGNRTEDEMEAMVVKHVVKEMCIEQYRTFSSSPEGGSSRPHDGNPVDPKPKGDETKYVVGESVVDAPGNSARGASGDNPQNNAVSDLHFSSENALFLVHPFAIAVITLITPFLIF